MPFMAVEIGDFIEVIGHEPGYEHAYFEGEVIGDYDGILKIQYEHLVVEKDGPNLVEMIHPDHVRPHPPYIDKDVESFQKGDVVDVLWKDGWWQGIIHDVFDNMNNEMRYEVFFDYMPKYKKYDVFQPRDVRPHQDWISVNNERGWVSHVGVEVEEDVKVIWERRWR
ncbi:hypothetical protein LXL04_019785 [Taraxacum kok-saghyz]